MFSTVTERPRPQKSRKNSHLEEIFRLKEELSEAQNERQDAVEMVHMMAQDLLEAREAFDQKSEELKAAQADLAGCEDELTTSREKVYRLSVQIQMEKHQANRGKKSTNVQSGFPQKVAERGRLRGRANDLTASFAGKQVDQTEMEESRSQSERELTTLQEQNSMLTASPATEQARKKAATQRNGKLFRALHERITELKINLDEKNAELTTKSTVAADTAYDKWQAALQDSRQQFETKLKRSEEASSAQLAWERELRIAAEAELDAKFEEVGALQSIKADLVAKMHELEEQKQRSKYFKGVSERLSKEVKDANEECREKVEAEYVLTKQLIDLKAQMKTLQQLMRMREIPETLPGS